MAYLGGGATSNTAAAATITAAYSPSVTAGSLLVAVVSWDVGGGTSLSAVSDSAGNTWTIISPSRYNTADGEVSQMAYALNANAGATTVTATFGSATGYRHIVVGEWSGVAATAALDQTTGATANGSASPTSGAVTTTTGGQLVVGQLPFRWRVDGGCRSIDGLAHHVDRREGVERRCGGGVLVAEQPHDDG